MDMTKVMNFSQVSVNPKSSANMTDISNAVRPVDKNSTVSDKSGNASFHQALHEAKDSGGTDDTQTAAASPKDPVKDTVKDEVQDDVSAQQNPAQDPLSAALAASQQAAQQNAQEAQAGPVSTEVSAVVTNLAEAVQPQLAAAAGGKELQTANQTAATPDKAVTAQSAAQSAALEALLAPTDTAEAAKSQQLLAMLSGNGISMKAAAQTGLQNTPVQTTAAQMTPAMSTEAATAGAAANMTEAANLAGTLMNPLKANADEQTPAATNADAAKAAVNNALQGTVVKVEQPADPGTGFQQQDAQQQNPQQDQQEQAVPVLQPQGSAQAENALTQNAQLPEEAVQDKAPVSRNEHTAATTGTTQLNAAAGSFQQNLQDVASLGSSNAQAAQPQTNYDIPRQIVDQAKLIKSVEDTQMVIKLKPEHLGELTLKVSVSSSGAVNASFHTDNAQVRGIIESSMVQLKQELQAQGLKVDNVGVYAGLGDGSLPNSQQGQAGYQQQSSNVRSQRADLASFEEETEAVAAAATGTTTADDGIDYRI